MKTDWKRKLTSRKLWLSIANFTSMLLIYFGHAEADAEKIAALIIAGASIMAYVIGEGLADGGNSLNNTQTDNTLADGGNNSTDIKPSEEEE